MKKITYIFTALVLALALLPEASAQVDRRDVRAGNRDFRKENYREADIDYRKALVKDSTSVAANYNLARTFARNAERKLYRCRCAHHFKRILNKIGSRRFSRKIFCKQN